LGAALSEGNAAIFNVQSSICNSVEWFATLNDGYVMTEALTELRPSGSRTPLKVSIVYCASCGYEPQTLELARALMHAFTYDLGSIELIPWQDGAFDVVVGGDLVHSMYRDGGFPASETVIRAVRERLR
jgi:selenoprotein W-related protein